MGSGHGHALAWWDVTVSRSELQGHPAAGVEAEQEEECGCKDLFIFCAECLGGSAERGAGVSLGPCQALGTSSGPG